MAWDLQSSHMSETSSKHRASCLRLWALTGFVCLITQLVIRLFSLQKEEGGENMRIRREQCDLQL